jgi:hypothetical protein
MNIWFPASELDVKTGFALTNQTRDKETETAGQKEFIHEAETLLMLQLGGFRRS